MKHTATVRPGIVGPGEPGHRVFESNYVIECSCGDVIGCATRDEATALQWRDEHIDRHERENK